MADCLTITAFAESAFSKCQHTLVKIGGLLLTQGFNGDLELPEPLRSSLNARYVGQVTSALAGGQTIEEAVYLVNFPFDGKVIQAEATFVDGHQVLIGTHLLQEYHLQVNFVLQTVELERVLSHN